jgi:hypothetical protein
MLKRPFQAAAAACSARCTGASTGAARPHLASLAVFRGAPSRRDDDDDDEDVHIMGSIDEEACAPVSRISALLGCAGRLQVHNK